MYDKGLNYIILQKLIICLFVMKALYDFTEYKKASNYLWYHKC